MSLKDQITPSNFESPHVHPLDLSPDNRYLAAVNTYANSVELYELENGQPKHRRSIFTGVDPVTVRFRSSDRCGW